MSTTRRIALATALAAVVIVGVFPLSAYAQCESNEDCRYGRVCNEGRCAYPSGSCSRDVDCPEGAICESGRCVVASPTGPAGAPQAQLHALPPPRPAIVRGLRPRRTDGGQRFVDPIEWGGRGAISPRPHGTSIFEFQYGNGQIPCGGAGGEESKTNSVQLVLGGDSIVGNIVSIGFSMALFRWMEMEDCSEAYSLGDVQMRLGVLAYSNSGPNHWFGLTPFIRILMSAGTGITELSGSYYAILEPGLALGFAYGIFSSSLHLAGTVAFTPDDSVGGFNSHLSLGIRPINLLGIIADLEVGYALPNDPDAVPVAVTIGLRLYLGRTVALDLGSRIALTEVARYSDANAAWGLWSLGMRLSIVWRGLGRP